ncbi:MAG: type IV pilus modification protein PilV [Burkholderiales bacterium RIFCSPLOWO2_02_FULL_57_36]|nr:MAG: type IV pilus modification protein PilV [Burkholderiales bacterium RIFCSPLOWO2_02_FULL_57_36]
MTQRMHRIDFRPHGKIEGSSLIEVLMAIIILTFGLLGLAALQGKANTAELEAYQRGQALVLLQDMSSRIESNISNIASYGTDVASPVGVGATDASDCISLADRAAIDLCEWSKELKGASEMSNKGTIIEGRGCIETITANTEYRVSVAWQGIGDTSVSNITACGSGSYDSAASRRAVTTIVRVPNMAAS